MVARVTTLELSADRLDETVQQARSETLPRLQEQRGFKGFTILGDRSSGRVIGISYWESREDMDASEEAGREGREKAAQTGGAQSDPGRDDYEVLLDEMA